MPRSLLASLTNALRSLRYSYLFLPGLIALAFSLVAAVLTSIERSVGGDELLSLFPAGPEAARSVLTTIGATLATIVGVAFSITIVSLQLVSQQYTPRAVRGFLGDRLNQTVAGIFIGGFLYALVALRTVENSPDSFVPRLTVTISVVIAFVALAFLLVFVHHMGHSIDVANIVSRIGETTIGSLNPLYPDSYGEPDDVDPAALVREWRSGGPPTVVHPDRPGFVQALDDIPGTIAGRSFQIELLVSPGDFVTERHPLAHVWTDADGTECAKAISRAIAVTSERDMAQDPGYGVRQLADIAVKALSPSVNDPTTATTSIGYLQDVLERLAVRRWPAQVRRFADRDVTIVMRRNEFEHYLEPLLQVGRYVTSDARVAVALLNATVRIAEAASDAARPKHARAAVAAGSRIAERVLRSDDLDAVERGEVEEILERLERATSPETRAPAT